MTEELERIRAENEALKDFITEQQNTVQYFHTLVTQLRTELTNVTKRLDEVNNGLGTIIENATIPIIERSKVDADYARHVFPDLDGLPDNEVLAIYELRTKREGEQCAD